ncbi:MAG TPA: sigma factor-like helix-turn-helix DNA-binding protein [Kofleriaceae bacterium]|nr:sigma factor-like helix-turn-helix DNA-binding protein [Kofleriaceae bacterium]
MIDRGISEAWHAGRAQWPEIELDQDRFIEHLDTVDPGAATRFPTDLYLAAACIARDAAALAIFDRDVLSGARGAIGAVDGSAEFIDEALQRLRTSLLVGDGGAPRLTLYAGRGPLRAWVGIAAARTALMMRRSQKRAREVASDGDDWTGSLAMISTNNPELELLKRQYAMAFSVALRDAVAALEPRLRSVLKMSFVDGLSIDEIGTIYVVHRATAARWIQKACEEVFEKTRAFLAARLSLTSTELDGMNAMVRSQIDVSLSQLLPRDVD